MKTLAKVMIATGVVAGIVAGLVIAGVKTGYIDFLSDSDILNIRD